MTVQLTEQEAERLEAYLTVTELYKLGYYVCWTEQSGWVACLNIPGKAWNEINLPGLDAAWDACRAHARAREPVTPRGEVYVWWWRNDVVVTAGTERKPGYREPDLTIDLAQHHADAIELDLWRAGYRFTDASNGRCHWEYRAGCELRAHESCIDRAAAVAGAQRHREGR